MTRMTDKVAFIHYSKAAGRYINHYLREFVFKDTGKCLAEQQYKGFNSWALPFNLGRDWTEEELLQLAGNHHPAQYPTPEEVRTHHQCWAHDYLARQYVHNHHCGWSLASVQAFRRNGWFTFMFIREPAELLCSLWTWAQPSSTDSLNGKTLIKPAWLAELTLNDFIREMLSNPDFTIFYGLPEYVDEIDFVAEFNEENFAKLLKQRFDHSYRPDSTADTRRFSSGNPGYQAYLRQGLISDNTDELIQQDPEILKVRKRLS